MKSIISQKTSVLQRARKQCEAIVKLKKNLTNKEGKLNSLTKEEKKTQRSYETNKSKKKKLLAKVKEQRDKVKVEIRELERSAVSLQKMVDNLHARKKEMVTSLERQEYVKTTRGTLLWPVKEWKIVSRFGRFPHPDFPDVPVINRGIKVSVPYGDSVMVVEKGNVLFANNFKSYGKMIIVDHGNGFYSIYGHLLESLVRENDAVEKGKTIARAESVLYFEIRVDGKPEDPLKWLK